MKKTVFIILSILLVYSIVNCYAFSITQPANNFTFNPGQKVKVIVDVKPEENINGLMIYTYKGSSELIDGPPYEAELILDKIYVDKGFISAISKTPDDTVVKASIDITIQLQPDVKLEKIVTDKIVSIIKEPVGSPLKSRKLRVSGLFSDGIVRDINIVDGVQYTSSNPNVVTVDNKGVIIGLKLGNSTISVSVEGKEEHIDVDIFVNIDLDRDLLVKPTDTGIQLGWKLSPQDPEWVTGYMVFRTEDPDGIVKTKIADLPKGTTTYVDTTAEKGKTYYYGVQAISTTANERSSMTNMTPGTMH
jgi:hypothetical protein